jgi:hypothetical protein
MTSPHVSMSTAIGYIYDSLGLEEIPELTKDQIERIILTYAVPAFSSFYPLTIPYTINTEDKAYRVKDMPNAYRIHLVPELTIRNVEKSQFNETTADPGISGRVYGNQNSFNFARFASGLMMDQVMMDIWSASLIPDAVHFHPPNIVQIHTGRSTPGRIDTATFGQYAVLLKTDHMPDLSTIHPNLFEKVFLELCWIEFRRYLFPIRKRFETMSTPFGEIVMGMVDKLESAADEKRELFERLRIMAPKSRRRKVYRV